MPSKAAAAAQATSAQRAANVKTRNDSLLLKALPQGLDEAPGALHDLGPLPLPVAAQHGVAPVYPVAHAVAVPRPARVESQGVAGGVVAELLPGDPDDAVCDPTPGGQ